MAIDWAHPETHPKVVSDEHGCLVWQGTVHMRGYGRVRHQKQTWLVHRLVWIARHGDIPTGLVIDHVCRNRRCCNPDHLRTVTPAVNAIENSIGPAAINKRKQVCPKCLGAYSVRIWGGREARVCVACTRAYHRAYNGSRQVVNWRKEMPGYEKQQEYLKRWRERNREKVNAYARDWYHRHRKVQQ
jgi:hypothetical protein